MARKNQSKRLTTQHKKTHGVEGIFGDNAKLHELTLSKISHFVIEQLKQDYPSLTLDIERV